MVNSCSRFAHGNLDIGCPIEGALGSRRYQLEPMAPSWQRIDCVIVAHVIGFHRLLLAFDCTRDV